MILIRSNTERETEDTATVAKLTKDGFKPIEEKTTETGTSTDTAPSAEPEKELESMTVEELKTLAKEKGLSGVSSLTKTDLIAILKG